mmetsp:Transcript_20833/g.30837  ORF Transcript_20833/g.30837 Transcript_20833/m.30837 type:complete len:307 (-) Transcript_20833:104-1024(-)
MPYLSCSRSLTTIFDMIYLLSLTLTLICVAGMVVDVDLIEWYRTYSLRSAIAATSPANPADGNNHFHLLRCPNLLNSIYYSDDDLDDSSNNDNEAQTHEQVIRLNQASTGAIMTVIQNHEDELEKHREELKQRHWLLFPLFHSYHNNEKFNSSGGHHNIVSSREGGGKDLCQRLERILKQQLLDNEDDNGSLASDTYHASISITKIGGPTPNNDSANKNNNNNPDNNKNNSKNKNSITSSLTSATGLIRGANYQIQKAPLINALLVQFKELQMEQKATEALKEIKRWVIVDGTELDVEHQNSSDAE